MIMIIRRCVELKWPIKLLQRFMDEENLSTKTYVRSCKKCGKGFLVFRRHDDTSKDLQYCPICRKEHYQRLDKVKEEEMLLKAAESRKRKVAVFEKELSSWNVIDVSHIKPTPKRTLYIIGNGFDLMHGVESSYYSFRDSLGKKNHIRDTLELFLTPEDIWADFEDSLASFNTNLMASRIVVDTFLDDFDTYDEDAPAASFYAAVETAAQPMVTMAYELPRLFRKWVNGLVVQTEERPLESLFVEGKVLTFNYTVFVEELYGVPSKDVCYIHGCRKRMDGKQKEALILGHRTGASDDSYNLKERNRKAKTYRQAMIDIAQERVFDIIFECDKELTKNSVEIIEKHSGFFSSLRDVEDVVVIGHSYSEVDAAYFQKIVEEVNGTNIHWYCGVYGIRDLENLTRLMSTLHIDKTNITLFRTDNIHVNMIKKVEENKINEQPKEKVLARSRNRKWRAKSCSAELLIESIPKKTNCYQLIFPGGIRRAFFDSKNKHLFVIDNNSRILLLAFNNETWDFIGELLFDERHKVLNYKLRKVYKNDWNITFVYCSRLVQFSLVDASVISNMFYRQAPQNWKTSDEDITKLFIR